MAEEAQAGFDIRRTLMLAGVGVVLLFALLFFFFRGCASGGGNGYTVIYSDLDLKDAANAIALLKKNSIPYKIKDQGKSISVPKESADQARLSLAEKNLPAGGVVGWEIFDESKLGATDFDRRIQLIRAISGELSRTIKRIEGVENARVQIVIPETRLFATEAPPVTASVMLRLSPGFSLSPAKINGIVHLVASSVENLQTQNVIVIDDSGRILTAAGRASYSEQIIFSSPETFVSIQEEVTPTFITIEAVESEISTTEEVTSEVSSADGVTMVTSPAALSVEEKIMLRVKAKKELEQDLAGKAQEILNRFYPPQSSIVKVNVAFNITGEGKVVKEEKFKLDKLSIVILIDNRVDLKPELKQSTFKAVAAVIGYDSKRGDKIVLQKVPFHLATPSPDAVKGEIDRVFPVEKGPDKKPLFFLAWLSNVLWLIVGGRIIIFVLVVYRMFKRKTTVTAIESIPESVRPQAPPVKSSALEGVKSMVAENPQAVADLLKGWLSDDKQ